MERHDPTPEEALAELFKYHEPTGAQVLDYGTLRDKGHELSKAILMLCPPGPDRTTAIRKVREAIMTANASIATDEAARFVR